MAHDQFEPNDPTARRDQHYASIREHKAETQKRVDERRKEIQELQDRRQVLRMNAAETAGNIGLRYQADKNLYIRLVSTDEDEIIIPEVVPSSEPLPPMGLSGTPLEKPAKLPASGRKIPKYFLALDIALWAFTLFIGGFVGLGLATIAGLGWKTDTLILGVSIALGCSVLGSLKILVANLWRTVGHSLALGHKHGWQIATAVVLTFGGCILDAYLGAIALQSYLRDRAFREADVQSLAVLFPLALAITAPLLIAAGSLAYSKGKREPTEEEREASSREAEIKRIKDAEEAQRRQAIESKSQYRDALVHKTNADRGALVDSAQAKFDALKEIENERKSDWETLKENPEFKCLQGLIGQIDVLSLEITDKERELTNFKISRGYDKSAELKEASPSRNGHVKSETAEEMEMVAEPTTDENGPTIY